MMTNRMTQTYPKKQKTVLVPLMKVDTSPDALSLYLLVAHLRAFVNC